MIGSFYKRRKEEADEELEAKRGANSVPWSIEGNSLDSLNRIPLSVRFTPVVIFAEDKTVLEIRDIEWKKFVEKRAEVCFREGEAVWEHYQSETKGDEEKRLHYHAVIVSTEDAMTKWFQRQGYSGRNVKDIRPCNDVSRNYTLTKAFRYACKGGDCVANRNYPVDKIRRDYWEIDAEVTAYKESTKKQKKRKFVNWSEEVYAHISQDATNQVAIGCDIVDYYHKVGKLMPQPYIMGQMINTFIFRNNLKSDHPLSREDMFRRMYPSLA